MLGVCESTCSEQNNSRGCVYAESKASFSQPVHAALGQFGEFLHMKYAF